MGWFLVDFGATLVTQSSSLAAPLCCVYSCLGLPEQCKVVRVYWGIGPMEFAINNTVCYKTGVKSDSVPFVPAADMGVELIRQRGIHLRALSLLCSLCPFGYVCATLLF